MATLYTRKAGGIPGYEIRFFDPHGNRLTLYLGGRKYGRQTAYELKQIVENLVYYRDSAIAILDKKTLVWLEAAAPENSGYHSERTIQQNVAGYSTKGGSERLESDLLVLREKNVVDRQAETGGNGRAVSEWKYRDGADF